MSDTAVTFNETSDPEEVLDLDAVNAEIHAGAKALGQLEKHAGQDWASWDLIIKGLRGLRDLAFAQAHTRDMKSYDYRQAMRELLIQRKHAAYDRIDKNTRSACYALVDHIEDITAWYNALDSQTKLKWKHPESVQKHCPRQFVAERMRKHNNPPPGGSGSPGKKKKLVSIREDSLKALLMEVIDFLATLAPEAALKFRSKYNAQMHDPGPNDDIDDI